jgi:Domain of unknown function (DUF4136)
MKTTSSVLLLAVAASCYAGELKVFPSKTSDVRNYSTYTWLPPRIFTETAIQEDDPTYSPLIRAAVNRQLVLKGYKEVPEGGQLQIVSAGVVSKSSQLEGYLVSFGFDYFNMIGTAVATPVSRVNREGLLAVALWDPKQKQAPWAGFMTEALGKPGDPKKKIDYFADKLLKKLPAKK